MCVGIRVSARPSPLLDAKSGWVKPGRCTTPLSSDFSKKYGPLSSVAHSERSQMPSRQERRKAERDAAKRAPQAGAAGATAALANLNVNDAGGDWKTQAEDPRVGPGGYELADFVLLATHKMSRSTRETRVQ